MAFDSGKEGEDEEARQWWRQRGIVRGENGFDYGGERRSNTMETKEEVETVAM